ncbi:hypothetical protein J2S43_002090 [Catenuloplanes nepalensis]|uniref:Beta-xylosidase C-terminal Concanavalin A-like domain-containing protein n=1 Tax=Catenuloplanes nepalensis TaxID=587533 RepID=A0ABT9MQL9_9ACTN|nr:glycoside hydrolase 43 family protein [Catenuloplanes nepalensis]MDP9793578.1 hypothetical protein [Catenuloplanes nepalensis]
MSAPVYRNPILDADWSDPDVIRVGDDFWMTASSFHRVPGLPVLHSRDLVGWTIAGHALPRMPHTVPLGGGVWAPAIRHHDGLFWIVYPDPDHGIFVVTAEDPRGPWSEPWCLKAGRGLIDPCPLWAGDGSAYLVHAWAKSRSGVNNRLTGHRMRPDARELLDDGTVIVDGDTVEGCSGLEGPKIYQRDGEFWILAPAGGVPTGWQMAFRAKDFFGPYESRTVLAQGSTDVNGPHQGAWVTAPDGRDWFVHFQDRAARGRVVHLQPMRWGDDGWPVLGADGEPVRTHAVPVPGHAHRAPATSDAFDADEFGPQWTWQGNPEPSWHEMLRPGLRLFLHEDPGDLRRLPAVLGQRLIAPSVVRTELRLREDGPARAGITILGRGYAWLGLERTAEGTWLVCRGTEADAAGGVGGFDASAPAVPERDLAPPVPWTSDTVALTVRIGPDASCRFGDAEIPYTPVPGFWTGATVGLFAAGAGGHADFGPVRVAAP